MQSSKGDADVKNGFLDTVREGEGGGFAKTAMKYHVTIGKVESQGTLLFDAGNPKPVLCDNLKGGRGRETAGRDTRGRRQTRACG